MHDSHKQKRAQHISVEASCICGNTVALAFDFAATHPRTPTDASIASPFQTASYLRPCTYTMNQTTSSRCCRCRRHGATACGSWAQRTHPPRLLGASGLSGPPSKSPNHLSRSRSSGIIGISRIQVLLNPSCSEQNTHTLTHLSLIHI